MQRAERMQDGLAVKRVRPCHAGESSLRQLWRLMNMLFRVRNGELTLRDVKNEATSGDVYENKGNDDKMSS